MFDTLHKFQVGDICCRILDPQHFHDNVTLGHNNGKLGNDYAVRWSVLTTKPCQSKLEEHYSGGEVQRPPGLTVSQEPKPLVEVTRSCIPNRRYSIAQALDTWA
jgi:hypothetical protein